MGTQEILTHQNKTGEIQYPGVIIFSIVKTEVFKIMKYLDGADADMFPLADYKSKSLS